MLNYEDHSRFMRAIRVIRRAISDPLYRRSILYRALVTAKIRSVRVKVNGDALWINLADPVLGRILFIERQYEAFEAQLLSDFAQPDMIIFVIGANIGLHALALARRVGLGGRVVAFEPDPSNCEFLRKNAESAPHRNIVIEQKAVSGNDGDLTLYLSQTNLSSHRPYSPTDAEDFNQGHPYVPISVPCVSIDSYVHRHGIVPDIILMDIEGGEYKALRGMRATLERPDIRLVFEMCPYFLAQAGDSPLAMLEEMQEQGFLLYQISEEASEITPVTPHPLLDSIVPKGVVNLVATRKPI